MGTKATIFAVLSMDASDGIVTLRLARVQCWPKISAKKSKKCAHKMARPAIHV
jgi:hypothetical protein